MVIFLNYSTRIALLEKAGFFFVHAKTSLVYSRIIRRWAINTDHFTLLALRERGNNNYCKPRSLLLTTARAQSLSD